MNPNKRVVDDETSCEGDNKRCSINFIKYYIKNVQAKLLLIVTEYLYTGLLKFHIKGYICLNLHLKKIQTSSCFASPHLFSPAKPVSLWTPPCYGNTPKAQAVLTLTPCAEDYPNVESFNPKMERGRRALYPPAGFF